MHLWVREHEARPRRRHTPLPYNTDRARTRPPKPTVQNTPSLHHALVRKNIKIKWSRPPATPFAASGVTLDPFERAEQGGRTAGSLERADRVDVDWLIWRSYRTARINGRATASIECQPRDMLEGDLDRRLRIAKPSGDIGAQTDQHATGFPRNTRRGRWLSHWRVVEYGHASDRWQHACLCAAIHFEEFLFRAFLS